MNFKGVLTLTGLTRVAAITKICEEYGIVIETDPEDNPENTVDNFEQPPQNKRLKLIDSLMSKHCPQLTRNNRSLEFEVETFRDAPIYSDILEFWKKHNKTYPKLAKVARVLLGQPVTTAKSEGEFSVSGCLLRKRRASITPTRVEKVLLIHDNFFLLK